MKKINKLLAVLLLIASVGCAVLACVLFKIKGQIIHNPLIHDHAALKDAVCKSADCLGRESGTVELAQYLKTEIDDDKKFVGLAGKTLDKQAAILVGQRDIMAEEFYGFARAFRPGKYSLGDFKAGDIHGPVADTARGVYRYASEHALAMNELGFIARTVEADWHDKHGSRDELKQDCRALRNKIRDMKFELQRYRSEAEAFHLLCGKRITVNNAGDLRVVRDAIAEKQQKERRQFMDEQKKLREELRSYRELLHKSHAREVELHRQLRDLQREMQQKQAVPEPEKSEKSWFDKIFRIF